MNTPDCTVELVAIAARLAELLTAGERETYNDPIANLYDLVEDLELEAAE
ncbi:hypothetical protein [Synechococcus sp. CBW1107]|nr:hypothetical protein [Synechococcus sp. CBW1107]